MNFSNVKNYVQVLLVKKSLTVDAHHAVVKKRKLKVNGAGLQIKFPYNNEAIPFAKIGFT